jgi:hypothetical protein
MEDNTVPTPVAATPPQVGPSEGKAAPVVESQSSDVEVPEPWLTSTDPQATSDDKAAPQEQQDSPKAPAKQEVPDIDKLVAERVEAARRKLQSENDQRIHLERLRAQAEARAALEAQLQQQADAQRINAMDDEEFGKFYREQSKTVNERQAIMTQAQQQAALGWVNTIRAIAQKKLTDEEKAEFQRRDTPGSSDQFQSFEEMLDFLSETRVKRDLEKAVKEKEKTIREAIEKERAAREAEENAPILDSGRPTPSDANASSEDNILAGIIELQRNKRRG